MKGLKLHNVLYYQYTCIYNVHNVDLISFTNGASTPGHDRTTTLPRSNLIRSHIGTISNAYTKFRLNRRINEEDRVTRFLESNKGQ